MPLWYKCTYTICPIFSTGTTSETGWSNTGCFAMFVQDHFYENLPEKPTAESPVVLIYDGHVSHASLPLIDWGIEHHVKLFCLLAHTSHICQPLDVACYKPLETYFTGVKHRAMKSHTGRLDHEKMCTLACSVYEQALSTRNLISGFKKTGIVPCTFTAIPASAVTPAELYNTPPLPQVVPNQPDPSQHVQPATTEPAFDGSQLLFTQDVLDLERDRLAQDDTDSTQTATEGSQATQGPTATEGSQATQGPTDVHIICGKCQSHFYTVNALMLHLEVPCTFFTDREEILAVARQRQPARRNDLNRIIAGREMTHPEVREAVRAHVAKSNRKAAHSSRHFNAAEDCCVCRSTVPPLNLRENEDSQDEEQYLWAQCDDEGVDGKCTHWVHLEYCTDASMFDPSVQYLCPCCS